MMFLWKAIRSALTPAADGPPVKPTAAPGARVLIVDDHAASRRATLRAASNLGYMAEFVSDGEQALQAFSPGQFAAILMDCHMPGLDGYQAATQIRHREWQAGSKARTPIIAIAASAAECDPERCRAADMDDYLAKPIRLAELSRALERWTRPASPVPASTTGSDPANDHSPIRLPEAPLRT
jgi:two-component system, sensor histidine kinase and response regulator